MGVFRVRLTYLLLLPLAALCVQLSVGASNSLAGILMPEQVSFGASDLDRALEQGTPSSSTRQSSSRRSSHEWPSDQGDRPSGPLELANTLPTGNTSSSTSSSSAGGAVGSGVVICLLNGTLMLNDDSPLGSLAEDHGFSLPEPPGTDLLRPPQH
jgi:hypothetical protein